MATASPTNNTRPTWGWNSGGGGNGTYRYKLDDSDLATGATTTTVTSVTPDMGLTPTSHTLYVQERDIVGNWSVSAAFLIQIDTTAPTVPTFFTVTSPTNNNKPTWSWASGGGGNGMFRYKLDNADLTTGASTPAVVTAYSPERHFPTAPIHYMCRNRMMRGTGQPLRAMKFR